MYAMFGSYRIYDKEIVELLKKHMTFFDRLDIAKVVSAASTAFTMIHNEREGEYTIPEGNWKFRFLKDGNIGLW